MFSRLRHFTTKARPVFTQVENLLFPARCAACSEPVAQHGALCGECWRDMHFISDPACVHCGLPFEYAPPGHMLCGECIASPPAFTRACSVMRYNDKSRAQVLAFKFQDRTQLAPLFGRWLAQAAAREFVAHTEVILPVPLHYRRLVARRYNQAALLAQALGQATGLPVLPHTLRRKRVTQAQSGLSRKRREDNVRGAFTVPPRLCRQVKGRAVLLVDDVMTTGATLSACARVLRDAGARDVYALTVARTVLAI